MRTLDRYLVFGFLRNFFPAWLGLVLLFYAQAMIAEIPEQPYPAVQILWRAMLGLPQMFIQMAPPAVLAGMVLTLSGFARSGELTAYFSVGFSRARILASLGAAVLVICCALLVFQDRIAPLFARKQTTYYWHVMKNRPDFFLDVKRDKIWYRSRNLIFNLRSFDSASRTIYGMSVYTLDERFQLAQLIEARKGYFSKDGWKLVDGSVTVFDSSSPFPLSQKFREKELLISETPRDFQEIEKEVDTLRLRELSEYIARTKATGTNTRNFEVKLHSRIAVCFIPLVMGLLGIPFSMSAGSRSGGVARDIGLAFVATFFYWLFHSVSLSLGLNGALHPLLAAWIPSVLFLILAVVLMLRKPA